jgi:ribosomal protein S13
VIEDVRAGGVDVRQIFESEDPLIRTIKVVTVVENLPSLGKVKARRILDEVGVSANLKIEHLDSERRSNLLDRLEMQARPDSVSPQTS